MATSKQARDVRKKLFSQSKKIIVQVSSFDSLRASNVTSICLASRCETFIQLEDVVELDTCPGVPPLRNVSVCMWNLCLKHYLNILLKDVSHPSQKFPH